MNATVPSRFAEGDETLTQDPFANVPQEARDAAADAKDTVMAALEAQLQGHGPEKGDPEVAAVVGHEREGLEPIVASLDEPAPQEVAQELGFPQMEDDGTSGLGAS